jgi:hypothetical protein
MQNPAGVFWSNGYPLMNADDTPIIQEQPSINSKSNYFSSQHPYPVPVSEGKLLI